MYDDNKAAFPFYLLHSPIACPTFNKRYGENTTVWTHGHLKQNDTNKK